MTAPTVQFTSKPIEFGPTVTLDPKCFVTFDINADPSGGERVDLSGTVWSDWNDDAIEFQALWSTASKPDKTED